MDFLNSILVESLLVWKGTLFSISLVGGELFGYKLGKTLSPSLDLIVPWVPPWGTLVGSLNPLFVRGFLVWFQLGFGENLYFGFGDAFVRFF